MTEAIAKIFEYHIYTTLDYMLQAAHPHTVFTDQPSCHALLINIFTLDLDMS